MREEGRGDAAGKQLPVGVRERHRQREVDARARHDVAFEAVAVIVDDTRQHEAAGDIEAGPGAGGEAGDHAVVDMDIGRLEATVGHQHAAAQKVQRHITIRSVRAPGRRFGERTSIVSMRDEFAKTQQRNRDS